MINIKTALDALRADGRFRVLEKYEKPSAYHIDNDSKKFIATFVDVETTGLNPKIDKIIELGMATFEYSKDGRIFRILEEYSQYQDPGIPIPEKISQLTGISDQMVQGKSIDEAHALSILDRSQLLIAHNAAFDQAFIEAHFKRLPLKPWACTISNIPWDAEGLESTKLEYLAYKYGFFFEGHRAAMDCLAGVHILAKNLPKSGMPTLKALLDDCRAERYRLWAVGAPFDAKDVLKERGYRWCAENQGAHKAWWIILTEAEVISELAFLWTHCYQRCVHLPLDKITPFNRFSSVTMDSTVPSEKLQSIYTRAEAVETGA